MSTPEALFDWENLRRFVNGEPMLLLFGAVGVRDPDNVCESYDGKSYDGTGSCMSDGHYECANCSLLSPLANRFTDFGRDGRRDRLRLYWGRTR